ncbi:hypothetical protein [Acuticoccus yangtzensis]|uniref:hypothetical protein n=1 Tax=Acuticoccus yangtzensis TaxID=1443441 RepID=UPI000949622A|nr:hypothetical protein [Acuticoccus yangtzensis]
MTLISTRLAASFIVAAMLAGPAWAETAAPTPAAPNLGLSLNSLQTEGSACRVTFVATNAMGVEVDDLGIEVAIFRKGGALERLMRLNLGHFLDGKTRVRQFDLAGTDCTAVEAILINDVTACDGDGLDPLVCLRAITATSNTDTGFSL